MRKKVGYFIMMLLVCCLAAGCSAGGSTELPSGQSPAATNTNEGAGNQSPDNPAATPGEGTVKDENGSGGGSNNGTSANAGNGPNNGSAGDSGGGANGSSGEGGGQQATPDPRSEEISQTVERMSLEEKLGQMIIAGVDGNKPGANDKTMIEDEHVGGIIFYKNNLSDPKSVVNYVDQLKEWNGSNAAPLFLSVDEEGGRVSRLPGVADLPAARAVGKANDTDYAAEIGRFLGDACRAMGINVDFAPVLDINSNPDNPVIGDRSYGATAELVSATGLAVMGGIKSTGVIPVVKHFPGHGDTSVDSHLEMPVVNKTLKQLQSFEWQPFKQAVDGEVDVVMIAHILFPKLDAKYPASLSRTVITDELRGTLGFKGVVITDDLTMGAIAEHFGMGQAAVQTVKAGSDILLVAHGYDNVTSIVKALKTGVDSGEIKESRIDESVARILALKQKYGITDGTLGDAPDLSNLNQSIKETIAGH